MWMADDPMYRGPHLPDADRPQIATATMASLKHKLNVDSREHLAATTLELNEIGLCNLALDARSPSTPTPRTARRAPSSSSTA